MQYGYTREEFLRMTIADIRPTEDVPALMTMGSQLGLAIANVRLYQDTRTERLKLNAVINSIAEGVVLCNRDGRLVRRVSRESVGPITTSSERPIVDSLTIAGVVFACTFGGALFGMYLRRILPESHLSSESKDVVKMGTGLLATLAALVLGLLVASAKSSYDAQRTGFQQLATNLILLDRSLKFYGPEGAPIREQLRCTVALLLDLRWPTDGSRQKGLDAPELTESGLALQAAIRNLSPGTDAQKATQTQALQVASDLARTRWQLTQAEESAIPIPFLVVLIFWLTVLFITFGLFSPPNATVIAALFICALSASASIFLILELSHPFAGLMQISSEPLRKALAPFFFGSLSSGVSKSRNILSHERFSANASSSLV
jgi:hypothetical protein